MTMYLVRCRRNGKLLAEYELLALEPMDPTKSRPPTREQLVMEAQSNLTGQGLAGPPYEGIEFELVTRR